MYPSFVIVLVALQRTMNETTFWNASQPPHLERTHVSEVVFVRHSVVYPAGLARASTEDTSDDVQTPADSIPKEEI